MGELVLRELGLFAGAGGGILGGRLLGWRTVCAVEIAPYCRRVLLARQRDGMLPQFPIWDDIFTFDGKSWRGQVDVVSGGFPCQDISCAGKGAGIWGERSGLWSEMARVVCEVRPMYVFVENSPMLTIRGLGTVLGGLAEMGYDARWCVLGAHHVGAPHKRDRIWIRADLANADCSGCSEHQGITASQGLDGKTGTVRDSWATAQPDLWSTEPCVGRVVDGLANRVDRIKAIGNGQVPAVAAFAWEVLSDHE